MRWFALRAPDDGSGAAAPPAAAEPAAAAAAGAAPVADAAAPAAYRPDGLPDHLAGATDKETVDRLFRAYGGARQTIAERGEVPKDAKGYAFEPVEAVKPYAAALETDAFFGKVREAALANGIPTKAFNGFVNGIMAEMIAGEMVEPPFNPDTERAALVPGETDPVKRSAEADRIVRENIARVNAWKAQGMPEGVVTHLLSGMDRAATNQLVAWIAGERREQAPTTTGTPAGAPTQADLDNRLKDPRNRVGHPKFDKAFAAQTTELFKQAYPGARA